MMNLRAHRCSVVCHSRPYGQRSYGSIVPAAAAAFTLLEMLVVIGIIAIITAIALPTLRSLKPDPLATASGQLLNDLAYARRRALADHTTVYVVFSCTNVLDPAAPGPGGFPLRNNIPFAEQQRILGAQYIGYALYEDRTIGDQPGQKTPHFITGWHKLPDGTAIEPAKFGYGPASVLGRTAPIPVLPAPSPYDYRIFDYKLIQVDPTNSLATNWFPVVAFDYNGSLATTWNGWQPPYTNANSGAGFDCIIPITKGYINVVSTNWQPAGFVEEPPNAWIASYSNFYCNVVIDGATGRARRDVRALQ